MKIVIDIPETIYTRYLKDDCDLGDAGVVRHRIQQGTPLPKGHGRLIDADAVVLDDIDFFDGWDYVTACNAINDAPTIIEAETEEE